MKQKIKNYLKLSILFFGIAFVFNGCTELEDVEKENNNFFKNIIIAKFEKIKDKPQVSKTIKKMLNRKFSKSGVNGNGFIIDTTMVQVLTSELYTNYTFKVEMETENVNFLTNYVLTIFNDSLYHQMLVSYPIINGEQISYDTANTIAEPLEGNMLIQKSCNGYEITEWVEVSIPYHCGRAGNHPPGVPCTDGVIRSGIKYNGSWVTTCIPALNIIDQGDSGHSGSGTSSSNNDSNGNSINIAVVPFEDISGKAANKECKKVQDFLDDPNNDTFIQELIDLSSPENLNSNQEKSVTTYKDNRPLEFRTGSANSAETIVTGYDNTKIKAYAHNHVTTTPYPSLSIFSLPDLKATVHLLHNNYLADDAVMFLTTEKGTQYAFTIHDKTKFIDAFYSYLISINTNSSANDVNKQLQAQLSYNHLYRKYWDRLYSNSLIRGEDSDNNNILKQFLKFIRDSDTTITLFKFTDTTFTNFKRVKLNFFGNPVEKECN